MGQSALFARSREAGLYARSIGQPGHERASEDRKRRVRRHCARGLSRHVRESHAQDDHDHEVDGRVLLECALRAQNRRRRDHAHEKGARVLERARWCHIKSVPLPGRLVAAADQRGRQVVHVQGRRVLRAARSLSQVLRQSGVHVQH